MKSQKIYEHKNFLCFMKRFLPKKLDYNTDDCVKLLFGVFKSQVVDSIHALLTLNVTNQFFPRNWFLLPLMPGLKGVVPLFSGMVNISQKGLHWSRLSKVR